MNGLTQRQEEVFRFIQWYINEHQLSPTIREIASYFSVSLKAVFDSVTALKKKNFIKTSSGARTIKIIKKESSAGTNKKFEEIPVLGDVGAGKCIGGEDTFHGVIKIDCSMLRKDQKYFALRVCGDSMIGIGIMDGDIVIIEKRTTAKDGDIVVVDFDDHGRSLKRIFFQPHRIKLQSENPNYGHIFCMDVCVIGCLAAVYRSYIK